MYSAYYNAKGILIISNLQSTDGFTRMRTGSGNSPSGRPHSAVSVDKASRLAI